MNAPRFVALLSLALLLGAAAAHAQSAPALPPALDSSAPAPPVQPTPAARAEYRDNLITFSEEEWAEIYVDRYAGTGQVSLHHDLHARRGERREDIDGARFYELVDRPDLASEYRTRRKVRIGGLVAGGLGLAISVYGFTQIMGADLRDCPVSSPTFEQCSDDAFAEHDRQVSRGLTTGLIGAGVTTVGLLVWRFVAREPVDNDTRRGLAAAYNRQLRERLGIPEPLEVRVDPYVSDTGGGLTLHGQF